jgi:hypothetical protein
MIGLRAFEYIVRDTRTRDIPLILETPSEDDAGVVGVWAEEINVLHELAEDTPSSKAIEGTIYLLQRSRFSLTLFCSRRQGGRRGDRVVKADCHGGLCENTSNQR